MDVYDKSESSNRKTLRISASVAKLPLESSIIHEIRSSAVQSDNGQEERAYESFDENLPPRKSMGSGGNQLGMPQKRLRKSIR